MNRRLFVKNAQWLATAPLLTKFSSSVTQKECSASVDDRSFWIQSLIKIVDPVLTSLCCGQLKASMPVETIPGHPVDRRQVTYLEAFARTLAGMSPGYIKMQERDRRHYCKKNISTLPSNLSHTL